MLLRKETTYYLIEIIECFSFLRHLQDFFWYHEKKKLISIKKLSNEKKSIS